MGIFHLNVLEHPLALRTCFKETIKALYRSKGITDWLDVGHCILKREVQAMTMVIQQCCSYNGTGVDRISPAVPEFSQATDLPTCPSLWSLLPDFEVDRTPMIP